MAEKRKKKKETKKKREKEKIHKEKKFVGSEMRLRVIKINNI